MQDIKKIKLIIGLGNPDEKYKNTYHNVGKLMLDYLRKKIECDSRSMKHELFEFYKLNNRIIVKPLTFMNESGKAVKAALDYFKFKPEEILAVHDDSDIELGKYKISFARGSAGHKGIESIIKSLGTKNFWRLRIGIRKEKSKIKNQKSKIRTKAGDLVLKKIKKEDLAILQKLFEIIVKLLKFNFDNADFLFLFSYSFPLAIFLL